MIICWNLSVSIMFQYLMHDLRIEMEVFCFILQVLVSFHIPHGNLVTHNCATLVLVLTTAAVVEHVIITVVGDNVSIFDCLLEKL